MQNNLIKIILVYLLLLILAGCATGSAIVVGQVRDPIDSNTVKLYLETPENYEVIGIVKASSDAGWTEQDSVNYAVEELKNQAAKLGANGVFLEATGEETSTIIGGQGTGYLYAIPVSAQTVSGKAIFVIE